MAHLRADDNQNYRPVNAHDCSTSKEQAVLCAFIEVEWIWCYNFGPEKNKFSQLYPSEKCIRIFFFVRVNVCRF